jgi:hypothetical protein
MPEIGLQQVAVARILGDLQDPLDGHVLFSDVELLVAEPRHYLCPLCRPDCELSC